MAQTTYCSRHKDIETSVSCARCGDPICPSCMVHAPVGIRCLDCARAKPLPTFDVSTPFLLRAIGAGLAASLLGAAVVIGVIWFSLNYFSNPVHNLLPYIAAILIAALGYGIGESISLTTNRKRGTRLKLVSGLCMLVGFTLITSFTGLAFSLFGLVAGLVGFYLAIIKF